MSQIVAAYIEELGKQLSKPAVKQHLAATGTPGELPSRVRMLFDYLVIGQILPTNPAYAVRGPKYVAKKGKTPVPTAEETRLLLNSINVGTVAGLRDRAIIGVMVYSFASCHTSPTTTVNRLCVCSYAAASCGC